MLAAIYMATNILPAQPVSNWAEDNKQNAHTEEQDTQCTIQAEAFQKGWIDGGGYQ